MSKEIVNVFYTPLNDISSVIRNQLLKLNNRWNGRMLENLLNYADPEDCYLKDAIVFYACSPDGRVASWAMVYKNQGWKGKWDTIVDFYTKKSERKKGYASCIAQVIREVYPNKRMYGERLNSTIFKRFRIT
jgi:hypothetical protein